MNILAKPLMFASTWSFWFSKVPWPTVLASLASIVWLANTDLLGRVIRKQSIARLRKTLNEFIKYVKSVYAQFKPNSIHDFDITFYVIPLIIVTKSQMTQFSVPIELLFH
jgi:hypothetical protein